MIFYTKETAWGLVLAALPALYSLYLFFFKQKTRLALGFLGLSALFLRLLFISLDPYLQEWDERFHALVAKNMMQYPFKPMLRVEALAPYDPSAWCCNHIWVHKQPLFMWQMAASMAVFGVNEIAMRLPAVVMGVLTVAMLYHIARFWTKSPTMAYIAAFLYTFSYYQLELTSGWFSLDQNDLAFAFYVTGSIWALTRHIAAPGRWHWPVAVGVLAGAAVLVKWLTALLVFGGWVLWLLGQREARQQRRSWAAIGLGLTSCAVVFLPWQFYIQARFPIETAAMHAQNTQHIFEALGSEASSWRYHFEKLGLLYGRLCLPLIPIGAVVLLRRRPIDRPLTIAFLAMIVVIYAFFTLVATKMPAFPLPVHTLIWTLIAVGGVEIGKFIINNTSKYIEIHRNTSKYIEIHRNTLL